MTSERMNKADRDALMRVARERARQAEREVDARAKTLYAEVINEITAEYDTRDALWSDAVVIAEEAATKANELIARRCAELGVPSGEAPRLELGWHKRGPSFSDRERRAELHKLAQARLDALVQTAKTTVLGNALDIEERLILGGLGSAEARAVLALMPTAVQLMPPLCIEDLGVVRWQPPEDAAARLITPLSPTDRRRRQIRRAIEANPGLSDRKIAEIAGCDHKTVATYHRGKIPTIGGALPTAGEAAR
jgi:hypothetical protein